MGYLLYWLWPHVDARQPQSALGEGGFPADRKSRFGMFVPGARIFLCTPALCMLIRFPKIPLIALQAAMPLKDMATSTSTFGFIRTLGGTIGISIGQVVFSSVCALSCSRIPSHLIQTLTRRINNIPGAATALSGTSASSLSESVRHLKDIAVSESIYYQTTVVKD